MVNYEPAKELMVELSPKVSTEFKDSVDQNKYTLTKDSFAKIDKDDSNIKTTLGSGIY